MKNLFTGSLILAALGALLIFTTSPKAGAHYIKDILNKVATIEQTTELKLNAPVKDADPSEACISDIQILKLGGFDGYYHYIPNLGTLMR